MSIDTRSVVSVHLTGNLVLCYVVKLLCWVRHLYVTELTNREIKSEGHIYSFGGNKMEETSIFVLKLHSDIISPF